METKRMLEELGGRHFDLRVVLSLVSVFLSVSLWLSVSLPPSFSLLFSLRLSLTLSLHPAPSSYATNSPLYLCFYMWLSISLSLLVPQLVSVVRSLCFSLFVCLSVSLSLMIGSTFCRNFSVSVCLSFTVTFQLCSVFVCIYSSAWCCTVRIGYNYLYTRPSDLVSYLSNYPSISGSYLNRCLLIVLLIAFLCIVILRMSPVCLSVCLRIFASVCSIDRQFVLFCDLRELIINQSINQ